MAMLRPPTARRTERGSVLVIALLLLLVIGFLGGIALLIAQTETGIDASLRSASLAFNAAEYGLNRAINQHPTPLGTVDVPGLQSVRAWCGRRNGDTSNCPAVSTGPAVCAPGNSPDMGCGLYPFVATGESTRFFVIRARIEVESGESILDCSKFTLDCG